MKKTIVGGFFITFGLLLALIANAGVSGLFIIILFASLLIVGNLIFWLGVYEWVFKSEK